jgi:hypothetical protein
MKEEQEDNIENVTEYFKNASYEYFKIFFNSRADFIISFNNSITFRLENSYDVMGYNMVLYWLLQNAFFKGLKRSEHLAL